MSNALDRYWLCDQGLTEQRYAPDIRFEDPVVRCTDRSQYLLNIRVLRTAFDIDFQVHDVTVNPPAEIVVR